MCPGPRIPLPRPRRRPPFAAPTRASLRPPARSFDGCCHVTAAAAFQCVLPVPAPKLSARAPLRPGRSSDGVVARAAPDCGAGRFRALHHKRRLCTLSCHRRRCARRSAPVRSRARSRTRLARVAWQSPQYERARVRVRPACVAREAQRVARRAVLFKRTLVCRAVIWCRSPSPIHTQARRSSSWCRDNSYARGSPKYLPHTDAILMRRVAALLIPGAAFTLRECSMFCTWAQNMSHSLGSVSWHATRCSNARGVISVRRLALNSRCAHPPKCLVFRLANRGGPCRRLKRESRLASIFFCCVLCSPPRSTVRVEDLILQ